MQRWTYDELKQNIEEDIEEFMADGLNFLQATARVQVEYQRITDKSPLEKLIIYMMLLKLGIEKEIVREDIRDETLALVAAGDLSRFNGDLTDEEFKAFGKDISEVLFKLEE